MSEIPVLIRSLLTTILLAFGSFIPAFAQTPLIANIESRQTTSLDGKWQYIIDPYETGFFNYHHHDRAMDDPEAYWNTDKPKNKSELKEFGYLPKNSLNVPGDWNSQAEKFLYYEGSVWYRRTFNFKTPDPTKRFFVYFGAVNYEAEVYLNGKKLGSHEGGFGPFNFEVPFTLIHEKDNQLVVHVNNNRNQESIPALETDWWNYGGITRHVSLIELPLEFIQDYGLQVQKPPDSLNPKKLATASLWLRLSDSLLTGTVTVEIPEMHFKKSFPFTHGRAFTQLTLTKDLKRWSPSSPKLYQVIISTGTDRVEEKVGFRTIEVKGDNILLNGSRLFLRGICIHGEMPQEGRRAYSRDDAIKLLSWAKELNCNMVRLAHYPHDELMTRLADSLGILVWSEIPVYWAVDFASPQVFSKARIQLNEMIDRDHNRASVIIWSVGNETPVNQTRTEFMRNLIRIAKAKDSTRLVTAALAFGSKSGTNVIDDPLGEFTDILSINEYLGWYGGTPDQCRETTWGSKYKKPVFFSETGAEALGGYHADSLTRWSEEYQEWYYKEQIAMFKRMGSNLAGISPWILADFRSPRRNNPTYQDGWNNKGLIDHNGRQKKAFAVLSEYYRSIKAAP